MRREGQGSCFPNASGFDLTTVIEAALRRALKDDRLDPDADGLASILAECERVIAKERPDRLLILGDTNSALSAPVVTTTVVKIMQGYQWG